MFDFPPSVNTQPGEAWLKAMSQRKNCYKVIAELLNNGSVKVKSHVS